MNGVKDLFQKKGIVTLIAAIICIVVVAFAYSKRVEDKVKKVKVYYAVREILPREEIKDDMIGTVEVASTMVTPGVVTQAEGKDALLGHFANYNTTIPKGSLFFKSAVVEWKDMPDSAWADIETGNTIVSLPVSGFTMFSNAIYPKAKIDLYYQTYIEDKLLYGKLIENIEVTAVKDENGKHVFDRSSNQASAAAIIFSVNEDLHLLLRKASYLSGTIVPVLRNSDYSGSTNTNKTEVSSAYIRSIIEAQSIPVVVDAVEDNNESIQINSDKKEENKAENKVENKVENKKENTANDTNSVN